MTAVKRTVPGTGLSPFVFGGLVLFSIALFFLWGGPFWTAPREASHVARFAVSYLTVIPAAALLLVASRSFSWGNLAGTTGLTWAVKMVVTATAYGFLATGTASKLEPAPVPRLAPRLPSGEYRAAAGTFDSGAVVGTVSHGGKPAPLALVWISASSPGNALPAPSAVDLAVREARHERPLVLVRKADKLRFTNKDGVLHSAHLHDGGRPLWNQPMTASKEPQPMRIPPRPGIYKLTCELHPRELAWIVVADGPYSVPADGAGRFRLDDVPAGPVELSSAVLADDGTLLTGSRAATVSESGRVEVELDVSPATALAHSPKELPHP